MKQKILSGESLDEEGNIAPEKKVADIISVGSHHRVTKSVLGGARTTKNGQHLRKIAEGLGDLNAIRELPSNNYNTDRVRQASVSPQ